MSTSVANKETSPISFQAKRVALIEQLCATRGAQYQGLKEYRSL